jgi:Asp/Glu/hydantoin racemase
MSIPRHYRYARQTGFSDRLAGDRAIDFGVTELEGSNVIERVVEVGRQLRDDDGAEVLILGCAGMGHWRPEAEKALDIPVIDPTQAAVARAIGLLALGYKRVA